MQQTMRWLDGNINLMDMSMSKLWEIEQDREASSVAVQAESGTKVGLKEPDTAE